MRIFDVLSNLLFSLLSCLFAPSLCHSIMATPLWPLHYGHSIMATPLWPLHYGHSIMATPLWPLHYFCSTCILCHLPRTPYKLFSLCFHILLPVHFGLPLLPFSSGAHISAIFILLFPYLLSVRSIRLHLLILIYSEIVDIQVWWYRSSLYIFIGQCIFKSLRRHVP